MISALKPRRLIVNADDFGLDPAVNAAVLAAHQQGVLRSASLMVAAPAAAEAVAQAQGCPTLAVGLHLTLVDGQPMLPAAQVPDLVDGHGRFAADLWRRGVRYFFIPRVRKQLEHEIRAQFAAFSDTGLRLDHANAHKHLHAHPTVLDVMLRVGRAHGLRAVRVPLEPVRLAQCAGTLGGSAVLGARALAWWVRGLQHRIRAQGFFTNDVLLGLQATGSLEFSRVERLIHCLPGERVAELYFHPATIQTPYLRHLMPDYRPVEEHHALCDPRWSALVQKEGITLGSYSDFVQG